MGLDSSTFDGTVELTVYFCDETEETYEWTYVYDDEINRRTVSGSGLTILSGKNMNEVAEFVNVESFSIEWEGTGDDSECVFVVDSSMMFEVVAGDCSCEGQSSWFTRYTLAEGLVQIRPLSSQFVCAVRPHAPVPEVY